MLGKLVFQSVILGTQLECEYRCVHLYMYAKAFMHTHLCTPIHTHLYNSTGKALFRSDNISTIAIIKDVLAKEATMRSIALTIRDRE